MADELEDPPGASVLDLLEDRLHGGPPAARLRQATVVDLSRTFEDLLTEFSLGGVLLAGFQSASHWDTERGRYEQLAANPDLTVAVLSSQQLQVEPPVRRFEVDASHAFADQWFLLSLTPMVSATLAANELTGDPADAGDERPFSVIWTFDPTAADVAWQLLAEASEAHPDLMHFASSALARGIEPMSHIVGQRYSVALLERIEVTRRRWRDLSFELMAAQQQLEERSERQVKLERLASIGTLAASVAHELNNPLASITMAASLMGQLDDIDERERIARIIEAEALRAGRIASDLLSYVADRELELSPTQLDAWLEQVASTYRSAGKPVTVTCDEPVLIEVDRDRLHQVVHNLVDNALDAIGSDGRVEIDLSVEPTRVVLHVTDDGVGIPETIRPGLFDPFVTSKPRGQGTGLGLPIARAHLHDHGGDLELVRTGPDGTRFRITLPRRDQELQAAPAADLAPNGADASADEGYGGRVLVVDDEPPIRSLLETLLGRGGWQVVSASGLGGALAAVHDGWIDVALIDIQLGIDDGPSVLQQLEIHQPGLRERTAYITGASPDAATLDGRPVLGKPFSWQELSNLLDQLRPHHLGDGSNG